MEVLIINILVWTNILVLLGALYLTLRNTVRNFLNKRAQKIKNSIKTARNDKEVTQEELRHWKTMVDNVKIEIDEIIKEATHEAEVEKKRWQARAKKDYNDIMKRTKRDIESEVLGAKIALGKEVIDKAIVQAELMLKKKIKIDHHKEFVKEFVANTRI